MTCTEKYRPSSIGGTVSTSGSARRSAPSIEYGVSEFGVWTAVSAGVKTLAELWTSFHGPLYSGLFESTKYACWMR